jgi:hypothetical protein
MTLGRYLGPTDPEAGLVLTAKILTMNGDFIRRNTFRHLEQTELDSEECKAAQKQFEEKIQKQLGEPITDSAELYASMNISTVAHASPVFDEEEDDELQGTNKSEVIDTSYDPDVMDTYITSQFLRPRGDDMKIGKVIKRSVDDNAIPKGKAHSNPILDSREYLVEFGDGEVLEYSANVIAENLYAQVDSEE